MTSLPGPYGIGDLGPEARRLVDALARARQRWWQILPLTPVDDGGSPYTSVSAFAGNPLLISPGELVREQFLPRSDVAPPALPDRWVDYARVRAFKEQLLDRAWQRFARGAGPDLRRAFARFRTVQQHWLAEYALYMALKAAHGGAAWVDWPRELVERRPAAMARARQKLAGAVDRHAFVQFLFFRQWHRLRRYAAARGVKLIGDVPIYVSADSADVWAHPHLFLLDRDRRPKVVAGVPPDCFSRTGQRWGNPLYDWPAMQRDGFAWWVARLRAAMRQVDVVRIDHFRGFQAFWQIPTCAPTARRGQWVKAAGRELFATLRRERGGLPLIAEDLGLITPAVEHLRDEFGLPGMRVLQFAFDGDPANPYLPHNHVPNAVVYTGTHDNDTAAGWYASLMARQKAAVRSYVPHVDVDPAGSLLRLAWGSVARVAIAPIQDVLGLGSEARLNTPGTMEGNWRWRLSEGALDAAAVGRLAELTASYGRDGVGGRGGRFGVSDL